MQLSGTGGNNRMEVLAESFWHVWFSPVSETKFSDQGSSMILDHAARFFLNSGICKVLSTTLASFLEAP